MEDVVKLIILAHPEKSREEILIFSSDISEALRIFLEDISQNLNYFNPTEPEAPPFFSCNFQLLQSLG